VAATRGWVERALAVGQPRWDETLRPPPRELAEGLYTIERRFFLPGGVALPTRSLAVRCAEGGLCVLAPPPDAEAQRDVAALGAVRWLVAPNSFHYGGVAGWAACFPEAARLVAPGLPARRPELPAAAEIREGVPLPCAATLSHAVLEAGRGVSEVAFLHRPSRTLILTDACFHVREAARARDRLALRLLGAWQRFGPSRTARAVLLRDRAAAAAWLERLCGWDFGRVVVAHGEPLEPAGPARLREAFRSYP
jgi:hypothetical protein